MKDYSDQVNTDLQMFKDASTGDEPRLSRTGLVEGATLSTIAAPVAKKVADYGDPTSINPRVEQQLNNEGHKSTLTRNP